MEQKNTETQDDGQKTEIDKESIVAWLLVESVKNKNIDPIFAFKWCAMVQTEQGIALDWVKKDPRNRLHLDLSDLRIFYRVGCRQHEDLMPEEIYKVMSCTVYLDAGYKGSRVEIHRVEHPWGTKILDITEDDLRYWMSPVEDPEKQKRSDFVDDFF